MPSANKAKTRLARNEIIVASIIFLLSVGGLYYSTRSQPPIVFVGDNEFRVQIADEPDERRLGLSGQPALANDEGMLFIFDEPDFHGIWMKNMNFSIDILWIDENQRVVHIEEQISPSTYPDETFTPSVEAKYVLEIYTGQVDAQDINLGDAVDIKR